MCPKAFKRPADLRKHKDLHGLKPYRCIECDYRFVEDSKILGKNIAYLKSILELCHNECYFVS